MRESSGVCAASQLECSVSRNFCYDITQIMDLKILILKKMADPGVMVYFGPDPGQSGPNHGLSGPDHK